MRRDNKGMRDNRCTDNNEYSSGHRDDHRDSNRGNRRYDDRRSDNRASSERRGNDYRSRERVGDDRRRDNRHDNNCSGSDYRSENYKEENRRNDNRRRMDERRSENRNNYERRNYGRRNDSEDNRFERNDYSENRRDSRYSDKKNRSRGNNRNFGEDGTKENSRDRRGMRNSYRDKRSYRKEISEEDKVNLREKHYSKKKLLAHNLKSMKADSELRLNRFISMGGVCSRRDADLLIEEGRVLVNGKVVNQIGYKVVMADRVEVDGKVIIPEKKIYILLNKPKDFVTTVDDPLNRKTVMSLIAGACKERVYPVGRLDRQTTGVLLFTNDGDLAKKLTHPSYDRKKIYHVFLNKAVTDEDIDKIREGITLEDGFIKADDISVTSMDKTEVGIEIHSGRNRIVRRIFEHLGYEIERLDRVYFAGITKKNVPRGKWRFLTAKEVSMLKIY